MNGGRQLSVVQVVGHAIVGGAETHVLWLLDGLVELGVTVPEVICPEPGPLTDALHRRGFKVRCISMGDWEDQGPVDEASAVLLEQAFAETAPDVVHFHLHPALVHGARAARRAGVPGLVYTGHGIEPIRAGDVELPSRLRFPVIAVAEAAASRLTEAGLPRELIEVIHNGVPRDYFEADQGAAIQARNRVAGERWPVLGTVARLSWEKGNDQALLALSQVVAEHPDALLLVAGAGAQAEALAALADELRVSEHVRFLGSRSDTPILYQVLDVFLLPSRSEACPLALLEAMAGGRPCVATCVGGVPEIISDGKDGLLVPSEDPPALARAILWLLRDDQARLRIGQAARERVAREFRAERTAEQTLQLYRRLAGPLYGELGSLG